MDIISRGEAKEKGLKYYYTGKECSRGHISKRKVTSWACYECARIDQVQKPPSSALRARYKCRCGLYICLCGPKVVRSSQKEIKERTKKESEEIREARLKRAREYNKIWVRNNKEKHRFKKNRRRNIERGAEGFYNKSDIIELLIMQYYRCAGPFCKCDISEKYTIDHIIPVSKGGSSWPDNLQMMCKSCNSSKRDLMPEDWIEKTRTV